MEVDVPLTGSGGGGAGPARLALHLPATLPVQSLLSVLGSVDGLSSPITEERIRAPDEALLLHIYNTLLTIPSLREAVALHDVERQEHERRSVDVETQLHDAERLKAEAEARAEEDRQAKESALKDKIEMAGQLAQAQGTLAALQSSADSGVQHSAEVKGRLDAVEQEKRGILEMLEREKMESARRAEEIDSLTSRSREARVEVNRLSTEAQEAKSAAGSAKFKIQSLEQELTLKSNDATWAHQELTKTTDELAQYRVRVHGELSSMTTQVQQKTQAIEALESKTAALQSAYERAQARLDEATRDKSELRQRLVEQEGAFKSEMATQQRLSALMEQQKDNAERRLADIEEQWERVLAEHRDREDALRQELAQEQDTRDSIVREKEEIQQALDRLAESVGIDTSGYAVGAESNGVAAANAPGLATPKRTPLSKIGSPVVMSPTAALASRVQKSGKSFTQVYADLAIAEEALRREKTENRRLVSVLEQVMTELHERAPALQAQREEKEQLEQHAEELSTALANACQERDYCERDVKEQRLQFEAAQRENVLLNQQVTDLIRQVRDLSREVILRDDPASALHLEPDGTQVGDPTVASLQTVSTDSQTIITEQLVSYRSLTELVTQNSRLLRVVRQLGAEMEEREKKYRSSYEASESEAINEATQVITRLQEDLRAERSRSEGVRRERDMFRAMTAQGRGNASATASAATISNSGPESNTAHVTLTHQYSQLQAQFEAFRSETANDMERLKEDAYQARSEASKSALSAAKENAARENAEERLTNAQQTYQMERKELQDLQRRYATLQESLSRQEITVQSISQQLVTAHSNLERLRNEASNLTAEKQLHKETTDRLMEEKKASVQERSNLSDLLRSAQTMQADLERSGAEVRRRLEAQVEKLDEQCKDLRDRATKEEEAHRQTSLRREVETTELRTKLERANEELSKVREQLAVNKNNAQHLTSRNEELQKQVNSKDEKLAVYERRSLSGANEAATAVTTGMSELSREQQLQIEVADLKGELRSAEVESEQARAHAEQFKSIAAANEEALAQLQASYDQYKAVTDAGITEKDSELTSIRERNVALANELTTAQDEASTERQERERQSEVYRSERKTLEDALSEVTSIEDRARATRESMQEEVRRQVQRTQEAHAKYEAELLAHAEDVKALSSVKEQLDRVRTQLLEAQKAQETAEGKLASSTDSWTRQRELLEQEKEEVKKITQELRGQNEALHKHMESLQAQTNEIRRQANAITSDGTVTLGGGAGDTSISSHSGDTELHEVIRYLRREKEIVDLQVELREQECARLRQSVEHTQRSLDEVRVQLSQEREQHAGANASAKQHEELMEKINQLSILRESNTTLRDEAERALRKVQTLEARVEALTRELEPLREDVRIKTVELDACQNQLRLSQEDNKRWQGRTQSILQQYNRIDPDELKTLQDKKEQAEKTLEEQKAQIDRQASELATALEEKQAGKAQFDKLRQQSIERIKTMNAKIGELNTEIEQLKSTATESVSNEANEQQLSSLREQIENLQKDKQQLEERVSELDGDKAALSQQVEALNKQINEVNSSDAPGEGVPTPATDDARIAWDAEKQALEERYNALHTREQTHLKKAKEFLTAMRAAEKERDELRKQLLESQQEKQPSTMAADDGANNTSNGTASSGSSAELDALRQRISELEQELEQANQRIRDLEAANVGSGEAADVEQLKRDHDAALREQEGRLSTEFLQRQKKAVEVAMQKASASGGNVEEAVQVRLKQFEDQRQAEVQALIAAKEQELRSQYEEQVKARYEAGKEEATLRNKLLLKTRDNKIEKLTAELNALKGVTVPAAVTPADGSVAGQTAAPPTRPAVASIRGGAAPRPVARPVPSAATMNTATATATPTAPARGGAPVRGTGRGAGQLGGAGSQKRKLEQTQTPATLGTAAVGGDAAAASAGQEQAQQGSLPKKPRPVGAPIAIRGGAAGGQRSGAANRGSRGGAPGGGGGA